MMFILCPIHLFAIDDGGNDIGLCHLLDVVVQEVAVEHRHIGDLAELDRPWQGLFAL